MSHRKVSLVTGVLGGLLWVVRAVLDLTGGEPGTVGDVLHWGGLALLGVAVAGFGAGLVSSSAVWLQLIVAVAFPLLVWSVLEVVHGEGDGILVDGVFGLVVLVLAGLGLARARSEGPERTPRRSHGAHAR